MGNSKYFPKDIKLNEYKFLTITKNNYFKILSINKYNKKIYDYYL